MFILNEKSIYSEVIFRISTAVTWAENSNRIVQRSQTERGKSSQMRSDIDNLINICSQEVWDAWSNTNNALARRAADTLETKSRLQMHLHKVLIDKFIWFNDWLQVCYFLGTARNFRFGKEY